MAILPLRFMLHIFNVSLYPTKFYFVRQVHALLHVRRSLRFSRFPAGNGNLVTIEEVW